MTGTIRHELMLTFIIDEKHKLMRHLNIKRYNNF